MARDEAEEEREFLADLKARSGQDLPAWMAAIAAQGFRDKNETIDWLRAQGFPFARASWLERIHSNGGRPIYLANVPDTATAGGEPAPAPVPPSGAGVGQPDPGERDGLEALAAAAKGYRPLYVMLEAAIRQAVPAATFRARGQYISVTAPAEFAAIVPTSTEIRLGLALGDRPFDATLGPAKVRGAGPAISHQLVLKDARQINAESIALVKAAHARSGG